MREYITLEQLVDETFDQADTKEELLLGIPYLVKNGSGVITNTFLNKLIHEWFQETTATFLDEDTNTMLCTYFYTRYRKLAIGYIDDDNVERDEVYRNWLSRLLFAINSSKDEYKKLISLYNNIKENLMDGIKSTVKYNDTPQVTQSGEYDNSFTSTITTSESEGASKIARLREIQEYLTDYFSSWSEEVYRKAGMMYE